MGEEYEVTLGAGDAYGTEEDAGIGAADADVAWAAELWLEMEVRSMGLDEPDSDGERLWPDPGRRGGVGGSS